MDNLTDHQRMGGKSVHIGDCYIWAEIYYLDSPTDYREHLPQNGADGSRTVPLDDWGLLEASERSPGRSARPLPRLMFRLVLLISGLVAYGVFEVLQAAAARMNTMAG